MLEESAELSKRTIHMKTESIVKTQIKLQEELIDKGVDTLMIFDSKLVRYSMGLK